MSTTRPHHQPPAQPSNPRPDILVLLAENCAQVHRQERARERVNRQKAARAKPAKRQQPAQVFIPFPSPLCVEPHHRNAQSRNAQSRNAKYAPPFACINCGKANVNSVQLCDSCNTALIRDFVEYRCNQCTLSELVAEQDRRRRLPKPSRPRATRKGETPCCITCGAAGFVNGRGLCERCNVRLLERYAGYFLFGGSLAGLDIPPLVARLALAVYGLQRCPLAHQSIWVTLLQEARAQKAAIMIAQLNERNHRYWQQRTQQDANRRNNHIL